jgi:phenylalanyl-tRNA synthetase beta chain
LIQRGYQEVVTYSFIDPADQKLLDPGKTAIELANPISSEMAVMRTSLWPGLVRTIMYNLNRQQSLIHIFESGLRFISQDADIKQELVISGALYGDVHQEQWSEKGRKVDFFDLKGDVEALLQITGHGDEFSFIPTTHPALHSGQSARIEKAGKIIGFLGALHPKILQNLGVSDNIYIFELEIEGLNQVALPSFQALSKYPSIRRDLAIVVDEQIAAGDILDCIAATMPNLLKEALLFDVYQGKGVDSGRKSLALGLILQESSRTLIDKDIDTAMELVLKELKHRFGAIPRE